MRHQARGREDEASVAEEEVAEARPEEKAPGGAGFASVAVAVGGEEAAVAAAAAAAATAGEGVAASAREYVAPIVVGGVWGGVSSPAMMPVPGAVEIEETGLVSRKIRDDAMQKAQFARNGANGARNDGDRQSTGATCHWKG